MKRSDLILVLSLLIITLTGIYIHTHLPAVASAGLTAALQDSREEVPLPVLMYHGLTDDPDRVDDYFILTEDFEKDLLWLQEHGYTAVSFQQLADYAEKGSRLPEKPVLLWLRESWREPVRALTAKSPPAGAAWVPWPLLSLPWPPSGWPPSSAGPVPERARSVPSS